MGKKESKHEDKFKNLRLNDNTTDKYTTKTKDIGEHNRRNSEQIAVNIFCLRTFYIQTFLVQAVLDQQLNCLFLFFYRPTQKFLKKLNSMSADNTFAGFTFGRMFSKSMKIQTAKIIPLTCFIEASDSLLFLFWIKVL